MNYMEPHRYAISADFARRMFLFIRRGGVERMLHERKAGAKAKKS